MKIGVIGSSKAGQPGRQRPKRTDVNKKTKEQGNWGMGHYIGHTVYDWVKCSGATEMTARGITIQ